MELVQKRTRGLNTLDADVVPDRINFHGFCLEVLPDIYFDVKVFQCGSHVVEAIRLGLLCPYFESIGSPTA